MIFLEGDLIDERYKIIEYLGKGGMSQVYKGHDTKTKRDIVLKALTKIEGEDSIGFKRFTSEIEVMSRIHHHNVIEILDFFLTDPYIIVMEYVKGKSLKEIIKKRAPMTLKEIIQIMEQIFSAMIEVESHNIVHRDMKPQNIIVTATGLLKVLDFGISFARKKEEEVVEDRKNIVGSVQYMSPEVVKNKSIDIQSDIYSLGIILYEMLIGNVPFSGKESVEVAVMHVKNKVPSIMATNKDFHPFLDAIVRKATARNKDNRYKSFQEFQDDFVAFKRIVNEDSLESWTSKNLDKEDKKSFFMRFSRKKK